MRYAPLQLNKNGQCLGIYCWKCSGCELKKGDNKGNMVKKSRQYRKWQRYKCTVCNYECAYDEAYVERNAIRQ